MYRLTTFGTEHSRDQGRMNNRREEEKDLRIPGATPQALAKSLFGGAAKRPETRPKRSPKLRKPRAT